jgi:hypothetical protein
MVGAEPCERLLEGKIKIAGRLSYCKTENQHRGEELAGKYDSYLPLA